MTSGLFARGVRPVLPALALLVLLAGFALFNLVSFPGLDDRSGHRYSALHNYHTGDILEIGLMSSSSQRERFTSAWLAMHHAPGSRLIAPSRGPHSSSAFRLQMLSFGRVSEIDYRRYDARALAADIDFRPHIVASARGARGQRPVYHIALSRQPSGTLIVLRQGRNEILADTALLPEGWEAALRHDR